ncbi:hypothetical protein Skr01_60800 [Sphaerisporangium krabiense]|uniref:NRDE family protein n=1 Tax=Sphaerisporangium krabiense TaxID=763782 RepID=A0A7W8ZBS7_9ACTN|nr:NRDE family protein [Sphaerisporangium krabiense]MBB5631109.1 hypothetical protein [Sphaerisporangium krabiense]GII65995.1 hypothetical protein Skr01_60800 [Sphaerisporangium krabiense]
MCTVVISFLPDADTPVVLAGVRDEVLTRPWEPPAAHWPAFPGLYGGRDLEAGGTWLAADPAASRVAALLNGHGTLATPERRRTRGVLPLRAAASGGLPDVDLSCYDPFHLLVAEPECVRMWSWDGADLAEDKLPEGTHVIVNAGREPGEGGPRAAYFRPRFAAAPRPSARSAAGDPREAWEAWRALAAGTDLPVTDPRALVVRRELPGGRLWGTTSVTLVALAPGALRYEFLPWPHGRPGDPAARGSWSPVPVTA